MIPRLSGKFLYLVLFSLCSSLPWELLDNGVLKNLQICALKPRRYVVEFKNIEGGLLKTTVCWLRMLLSQYGYGIASSS